MYFYLALVILVLVWYRRREGDTSQYKHHCTILHHWHETCQSQAVVYWVEKPSLQFLRDGSMFIVLHATDLTRATRGLGKILVVRTLQYGVYHAALVGTTSFVPVFTVEDGPDDRLDFVCQRHPLLGQTSYSKPISLRMHRVIENQNLQLVLFGLST